MGMTERVEQELIDSYIAKGYWKDCTLGDFVQDCAKRWKGRTALVDDRDALSYAELDEATDRVAGLLAESGVKPGDTVLLQLENCVWHTVAMLAAAKAGAVPIMALGAHGVRELASFARLAEPSVLIMGGPRPAQDEPGLIERLGGEAPSVRRAILLDDVKRAAAAHEPLDAGELESRRARFTDIGLLTCSGGSTNVPKLIPRRHADYLYDAETFAAYLDMDEDDVFMVALPASHNFVLGNPGALGTLSVGGTVVMCRYPSPDAMLPLIDEKRVTHLALVPALVSALLDTLEWDDAYDLSCLEAILVGGAVFEETLARRCMAAFPGVLRQVFGTAEGINFCTRPDDPDDVVARCQGYPISPADEWRIVDADLHEVPTGSSGELIARGPYTIQHYFRAPEAEGSFTEDGFYRTGDKARKGPMGCLVVEGRAMEQINRGGEKVMPSEMEGYLASCPGVGEVQVIGVPDDLLGNRICAFVLPDVLDASDALDIARLNSYLANLGISAHKRVDQLVVVEGWPLTAVGKIDRMRLRAQAMSS
ncbi:AMP-binding protein [Slackia exigua]|uniref:(2,3-dihydroxybenzoyl)adenylate synthase n=1 Tax=Slackia exigua TaxID=84109 RepID=UPI0028D30D08|nr:AMP-binding protein [Slackia exigua]